MLFLKKCLNLKQPNIYIYIYFNWNKYWSTFVSSIFFPQKKEFEKPNI